MSRDEETIWSVGCAECEGTGKAIRWYPATWHEPAGYDFHPFDPCPICDGTGAALGRPVQESDIYSWRFGGMPEVSED